MERSKTGHVQMAVGTLLGLLLVGAGSWTLLAPSEAEARDSDGSRLRAKPHEVGTTQEDELEPPGDTADWRYVEIEKERAVRFDLRLEKAEASLELRLTKATGEEIDAATCDGGSASLKRKLAPGLYYVEVTGEVAVSYSLSIE